MYVKARMLSRPRAQDDLWSYFLYNYLNVMLTDTDWNPTDSCRYTGNRLPASICPHSNETVEKPWRQCNTSMIYRKLEMWANAQRDGRPAEYRRRPLFNAAKFGWCTVQEYRAV